MVFKRVPSAVFLDRDGTLIRHIHYLSDPEKVCIIPGVCEALGYLKKRNVRFFLFTNQSGVGRGLFTIKEVHAVNEKMINLLGLGGKIFDGVCIATEAPYEPQIYRKPSPRFILETLEKFQFSKESAVMIGDYPSDWEAGLNAGIQSVAVRSLIQTDQTEEIRKNLKVPIYDGLVDWVQESFSRDAQSQ